MKRFNRKSFLLCTFYFLTLCVFALWKIDSPNQFDPFNTTLQQLIDIYGGADPASFATGAIDIANNGWLSPNNLWIFNLWPPGFVLLEAAIIKSLGVDTQFIVLILQILVIILFTAVLVLFHDFFKAHVKNYIAVILPLLIFILPIARVSLLQPKGVVFGESFSIAFFLVSVLLAIRSVGRNSLKDVTLAGLSLALSAYFRSQFELFLIAMTFFAILLVVALLVNRLRRFIRTGPMAATLQTIIVLLLVAHAATVPWRVYHWVYQGAPLWVQTSTLTFRDAVTTTKYLKDIGAQFLIEGHGNIVCRIDPSSCGDFENAKKLFVKTFFAHPVEWCSIKTASIGKYWFSSPDDVGLAKNNPTLWDNMMNGLALFALATTVALLFTRKIRSHILWPLFMWINVSLFSSNLAIFVLIHFEVRYFNFIKIFGIFMMLILLAIYLRVKEPLRTDNI